MNRLEYNVDENVDPRKTNQFKDRLNTLLSIDMADMTQVTITEILCSDKAMSACAGLSLLKQFQKICEDVEFVFINLHVQLEFR